MQKIMARLLACILFLSTLQGGQIWAADNVSVQGFEVSRKILQEDSKGLSEAERDQSSGETALIKWNISTVAKYMLSYYIEAEEGTEMVTKRIDIEVDNTDKTNIELGISTSTGDEEAKDQNHYVERTFDNASFTWIDGKKSVSGSDGQIKKSLKRGSNQSRIDQEFNITLIDRTIKLENKQTELEDKTTDNLNLKFKISGDYLLIYTNGIAKGNVTPFKLRYGTSESTVAEKKLFNGPKNYTITPTHLYMENGVLKNLKTIQDMMQDEPGSVPGIKINFDQIKEIENGSFKYADQLQSFDTSITLQLGTRYTLNNMTNALRLDFVPKDGEGVQINLNKDPAYAKNVVQVEADKTVSLYLSKKALKDAKDIIPIVWEVLDTSTIVDASFQYGNQSEKYWPANKGYTYLGYSFNKTSDNQVKLSIQPYNIKATATYSIYILENEQTELKTPQVVYEYDPDKTDAGNITAVVPVGTPCYFKVVVSIDTNTFESQMIYYHPDKYLAVPQVTQIKSIDNVYVIPDEKGGLENGQPQAIGFDIQWLAPEGVASLLEGNKLYYELLLRKNKDDDDPISKKSATTEDHYATYSKIFEVSLNEKKQIQVRPVAGTAGGTYNLTPEVRYNAVKGTFSMERVSLKNYGKEEQGWEQIDIQSNHLNTTSENYLPSIQGKTKNNLTNRLVPGTYYLSFRTVLVSDTKGSPIVYSQESNMVSLTLDHNNEIIPVPSNITTKDTTGEKDAVLTEQVTIENVDIRNYVKKMLEPADFKLYTDEEKTIGKYSGTYEIYLYQNASQLAQTIKKVEEGKIVPIEVTSQKELDLLGTEAYRDRLRKGEVLPIILKVSSLIGEGSQSFEIKGLDENEVYYIQTRVKLSPWRESLEEAQKGEIAPRYSLFSKEVSFTTTTTPIPPSPEDKVPPTPEKVWIESQKNNTTVTLGWKPAKFEADEDISNVYYEWVRTQAQLTDEEKARDQKIEALMSEGSKRVGFKTDGMYISTYLSVVNGWTQLDPSQESKSYRLTDSTLYPNTVYYYYVRTVCIIEDVPVRSTWMMIPVTTPSVGMPINIKIEHPRDYSHDTKEETVISFDAPVPSDSLVPEFYNFDFAVLGEMDESYSTTKYPVIKLTSKEDASLTPQGYTHFVYKITGLKPNKRYFIKIRVIDKTQVLLPGGSYPTSLYSDPLSTRTEYDEEEDNKDHQYADYIKKFEEAAENLKKKPYWVVEEGTIYKYRESYMVSEIGLKKDYELVAEEGTEATYYLPLSILTKASEEGTTFKITLGNYSASIRPYTLTEENEQIAEAIKLIQTKKLEDYYVEIHFSLINSQENISGQRSITPKMMLDMHLVYLKEKDIYIEADVMDALEELIEKEKKYVVAELEKKIYNGTLADEVLQEIIEDAIKDIEANHIKQVKRMMNAQIRKDIVVDTIEKSILLQCQVEAYAVDAYYLQAGRWIGVESYGTSNQFAVEASFLGTYILVGRASLIQIVPSLAPYQSFIAKYQLTDFFTLDAYMIQTATTKQQLYGAVARLLGAQRQTDYYSYLQSKKIKGLSRLGTQNPVRQDEEIYIMMQAYEILYNRPIKSVVIKNKQSVQNIGAFQTIYRDYVYAGVELKVVTPVNARVLPSKQMTVEETIKMLYKVQAS